MFITYLYSSRLPFNWRTPFGFLVAFSWQLITWTFGAHIISCVLCFLIALCNILSTILEDLKVNWHTLNRMNRNKQNRLFKIKLQEEIDARSQVQQLSKMEWDEPAVIVN